MVAKEDSGVDAEIYVFILPGVFLRLFGFYLSPTLLD